MSNDHPAHSSCTEQEDINALYQRIADLERENMQLKAAAFAVQTSEQHFQALLESISASILIHQNGHFRYANSAAEEQLGYTREEIYTLDFADFIHPNFLGIVQQRAAARMRGEHVPNRYAIKIIRKNGDERWIDLNNTVITLDTIPSIIVSGTDITDIKRTQEELRTSEERFRTMNDVLPVGTLIIHGTTFHFVNKTTEIMTGYSCEELQALEYFWDVIHPEHRELVKQRSTARTRGEDVPHNYEIQLQRKNGETIWVDLTAQTIKFDGQVYTLATIFDLTERKRAEEERRNMEAQVIEAQRMALRELSTPLMPLADGVVALPLVGTIDSERASQIMETLLQGVADYKAEYVILDVTGVTVVDTPIANAIIQSAQASQLLGAQVIITGIGPSTAQTLVSIGAEMQGMITLSTLQHGIAYALRHRAQQTQ